jgi:hypothetical protein
VHHLQPQLLLGIVSNEEQDHVVPRQDDAVATKVAEELVDEADSDLEALVLSGAGKELESLGDGVLEGGRSGELEDRESGGETEAGAGGWAVRRGETRSAPSSLKTHSGRWSSPVQRVILVRSQQRPQELKHGLSDLAGFLGVGVGETAVGEDLDGEYAGES